MCKGDKEVLNMTAPIHRLEYTQQLADEYTAWSFVVFWRWGTWKAGGGAGILGLWKAQMGSSFWIHRPGWSQEKGVCNTLRHIPGNGVLVSSSIIWKAWKEYHPHPILRAVPLHHSATTPWKLSDKITSISPSREKNSVNMGIVGQEPQQFFHCLNTWQALPVALIDN